jgi:hypothetical protein
MQNVSSLSVPETLLSQIVTSLSADDFGAWESTGFAPEAKFLEKLKVSPPSVLVGTMLRTGAATHQHKSKLMRHTPSTLLLLTLSCGDHLEASR